MNKKEQERIARALHAPHIRRPRFTPEERAILDGTKQPSQPPRAKQCRLLGMGPVWEQIKGKSSEDF